MIRRLLARTSSLALTGIVALTGAGCAADSINATGEGDAKKVTVVLDWTPNTNHAGLYLAEAEGYFAAAGLDVTIIEPDQNGAVAQLAAGNADFAISYAEQVIPARAEGIPIVSVATIIESNTSSLLAPADRGITRPRDLAGKRYGGFGGQLETALVKRLVGCDGGDPEAVRFVEVGNVDFRVGFDRGDYDFVWIFDGWDKIKLADLGGLEVTTIPFADHFDCIPDWYTPLLATSETIIANDPDLVRAFVGAAAKGYQQAMADPAASAAALSRAVPELDADLVAASAGYLATRYAARPEAWGAQDAEVWSRFEAFVREAGMVSEPVDTTAAFTNEFLPAAAR
jgi:ABC-type nitrate/sulfonate/bicarbonate transport system substrate-binding protein